MRIDSISGAGVLSFAQFGLGLDARLTFVVGPNGAGKSNLTRLLTICQRAIECADVGGADVDRTLSSFLAARYVHADSPAMEARVALRLTDPAEKALLVEFVRAMVTGAVVGQQQASNIAQIDAWAEAEITEEKLQPLMNGEIVARHPGTPDGRWEGWYEFTAPDDDGREDRYQWLLLGFPPNAIIRAGESYGGLVRNLAFRVTGRNGPTTPLPSVPGPFKFSDLLPTRNEPTGDCSFDVLRIASGSQRRFAQMTGLSFAGAGSRASGLATVLRAVMRTAFRHTSDQRLLPSGGTSWSSSELTLTSGAEGRLPEFLLRLKMGDPAARVRYQRLRELFHEFTQGRGCEVRLMQVPQPAGPNGESNPPTDVPAVFVTVSVVTDLAELAPEVPIEFAGAGAWEALVLASVLCEQTASVVLLDEPAVALHQSLQRCLAAHIEEASAQVLVISHSAELLPLRPVTDLQLVRLDRDANCATQVWRVSNACWSKISPKLTAKGNAGLPFAAGAVLCEGQVDQEAINTLAEVTSIDLRQRNILVTDCGSRDNMPDYIWFCAQLGVRYLAVMDADASKPDAQASAQAVRDAVSRHGGGELFEFPENLEATFGVPKQRPSLVPGAIRALPLMGGALDPTQVPAEVIKLADEVRRLTS